MQELEAKKWKAGVSDEAWKIAIDARDIGRVEEIVTALDSILFPYDHSENFEDRCEKIAKMNSADIATALLKYRESHIQSIRNGMTKK